MSSFLTQCPHCLTPFRVTETQIEAAEGLVRCGACLGIFSALSNRITLKQPPEEAAGNRPDTGEDFPAPDSIPDDAADDLPVSAPEEPPELTAVGMRFLTASDPPEADDSADSFPPATRLPPASGRRDGRPAVTQTLLSDAAAGSPLESDELDHDIDIPLGDFDLDSTEDLEDFAQEFDTEDEDDSDEDEDEDEDEDDDDGEFDDEEFDDEDELDETEGPAQTFVEQEAEEAFEEYADEDEPGEPEPLTAVADTLGEADAYDNDDLLPEPAVRRAPLERITVDKTALRRYLAKIEDAEGLEALDDSTLEAFSDEPVTLDVAPRRSRWRTGALFGANLLLAALLMLQYTRANLDTLSANPRFVPLLPYVCRVLTCPEPERSQIASLISEQLLVRSHPRYAQALELSFIFRNDARVAQPFPAIELGFSDTNNQLLANRLFQPAEYLPPELQSQQMPAKSTLQITLELADPGSEAVNYTLAFREP